MKKTFNLRLFQSGEQITAMLDFVKKNIVPLLIDAEAMGSEDYLVKVFNTKINDDIVDELSVESIFSVTPEEGVLLVVRDVDTAEEIVQSVWGNNYEVKDSVIYLYAPERKVTLSGFFTPEQEKKILKFIEQRHFAVNATVYSQLDGREYELFDKFRSRGIRVIHFMPTSVTISGLPVEKIRKYFPDLRVEKGASRMVARLYPSE